jgi:adenylate cyclase
MTSILNQIRNRLDGQLSRATSGENDAPGDQLRRKVIMLASLGIAAAAFFWGALYLSFGAVGPSLIPFGYSALVPVLAVMYVFTRAHTAFRIINFLLIAILPVALQLSLGGFVEGSGVSLWAIVSPLSAAALASRREATLWFFLFFALLAGAGILDTSVERDNGIPDSVLTFMFVMNSLGPSLVAAVLLRYFVGQREHSFALLNIARQESDRLLLNVLPVDIADELKRNNEVQPRRIDSASVLFADVVGSTSMTVELTPEEMVHSLNAVFSEFDKLVDKYGLEKIRTIGDNYMVASGVPTPRDDHAHALANFALEIVDGLAKNSDGPGSGLQFRIGMNSGPVVGGVIGNQKFHYDIWGDMVNVASRMESNGLPGKIQIASGAHELINKDFHLTPRGEIEVRGKGAMQAWFLDGPR